MELKDYFLNTDYSKRPIPPKVLNILNQIVLKDFNRDRDGYYQSFYFQFTYKEKKYILIHSFLYHASGVRNWFKLKKPFFSLNPFRLNKNDLEILSNELMRPVNEWNASKKDEED